MKPRIVIDLDDTLTVGESAPSYAEKSPDLAVVRRLRDYRDQGFAIVVHTARNMRTFAGNVGLINVHTLPEILAWLQAHDIPHDEVIVGKPWCGPGGFYVDDKAIRPDEFKALSLEQIRALTGTRETGQDDPAS